MVSTADPTCAISVRGLVKSYAGHPVVDGIDLDVRLGEVFALLGPNGAGKTTTVEILEGYRRRDSGDVQVLGEDPAAPADDWRARIGIVLQAVSDLGELTVGEALAHFAGFYPQPRDVREVLALVGLDGRVDTRVRQLSGGQRRRLDVGLGIVGRPELLFLDEPTTGFDPQARRSFWSLIRALAAEGTTMLLTTHYLDEAEHLADRLGVLSRGRLLEVGSPQTLGGRARDEAVVGWLDDDGRRTQITPEPTQFVLELARRFGGEVPGLSVSRPTLEDVYLRMVGSAAAGPADDASVDATR